MCCYLQLAELFIYFDKYGRIIWHDASDSLKVFNRKWTAGYSYIRVIVVKILMSIWHLRANLIEVILVTACHWRKMLQLPIYVQSHFPPHCSATRIVIYLLQVSCTWVFQKEQHDLWLCACYISQYSALRSFPSAATRGWSRIAHRTNGMLFFEWH